MVKFYSLLILLFVTFQSSFAQKGTVAGQITDKSNGETLIGASIQLENLAEKYFTVTDIDGNYNIKVNAGRYKIKISYVSYETVEVEIQVNVNEIFYLNQQLAESNNVLKEAIITSKLMTSGTSALLLERKKASQVSDGIAADVIRKTPDRTTSEVLKRITSTSIQEGKFAIIRGMNDRYNAGYLDGALMPSTESDRKAFAFDVIPANLIDNITIIKSGTADLVGDFGGGIIKINTKAVPESLTQSFSIGAQTNSITTFRNFTQFKTYPGEQFNIISSARNMPIVSENEMRISSTFATTQEKLHLANTTKNFNNDWSIDTLSAIPNIRFAYTIGFPIQLKNNSKLGMLVSTTYSDTRKTFDGLVNSFDGAGQVSSLKDVINSRNINTGGIFNINFVSQKTSIGLKNLLNANTDNNVITRTGIGNISDDIRVLSFSNIVNYNRFYNGILVFKKIIGNEFLAVNSTLNYSSILRKIPDYRIVNYTKLSDQEFNLSLGDFFNSSSGRFFSTLSENILNGNAEISKQLKDNKVNTEVKLGYSVQNRYRSFTGRSFVYNGISNTTYLNPSKDLGIDNIASNKLYLLEKTSNDLGYYQGKSLTNSYFVSIDQTYNTFLRLVVGARFEHVNLSVNNPKFNMKIASIRQNNWLPSINLSYYLNERSNLRADYFASLNRPEFRELAPFAFYVFDKNVEIKGNNDLKIANLNNFDLRYEFFPSKNELLSAGLFYKSIINPIEYGIDITQPFTTFTLKNEKAANIYGLEMELKKKLSFISSANIWNNLSVFSNFSLIHSRLEFASGTQALQNRPLQGQSPYVFNAGLQYDNLEKGWSASAVFNKIGRRIAYVGVDPKFGDTRQDIYEAPRSVLDVQIAKTYKKFNFKFTLGDILRNNFLFYQDVNHDGRYNINSNDRVMFKTNAGYTINLSLNYSI